MRGSAQVAIYERKVSMSDITSMQSECAYCSRSCAVAQTRGVCGRENPWHAQASVGAQKAC